LRWARGSCSIE